MRWTLINLDLLINAIGYNYLADERRCREQLDPDHGKWDNRKIVSLITAMYPIRMESANHAQRSALGEEGLKSSRHSTPLQCPLRSPNPAGPGAGDAPRGPGAVADHVDIPAHPEMAIQEGRLVRVHLDLGIVHDGARVEDPGDYGVVETFLKEKKPPVSGWLFR